MTDNLVALLHLCDSLFPIGSFAHSDGLEAATSRGEIATPRDLGAWMDVTLTELLRRVEGPAVARAWDAVRHERFDALASVDDEVRACDLRRLVVSRRARWAAGC
jgi:urease accessory protein